MLENVVKRSEFGYTREQRYTKVICYYYYLYLCISAGSVFVYRCDIWFAMHLEYVCLFVCLSTCPCLFLSPQKYALQCFGMLHYNHQTMMRKVNKPEDIIDSDLCCSLNVSQNTQLSRSFTRQAADWIEWKRRHQYAEISERWGEVRPMLWNALEPLMKLRPSWC